MRKKLMSLLLTGVLATSLLTGCGSTDDNTAEGTATATATESKQETVDLANTEVAEKTAEITYANFNASGGNEETLQKMYDAFHEEYPNITVNIETIGYDDYFTQMQTRVAGGTAPDCYELNIENFAAYANKGVLAELTGIDTSGYNTTALNAFSVDGKQYGVPGNFSNVVLIYNKFYI